FPYKAVTVLVCCVSINAYTRVNLLPYVGIMAMQLMGLESINESGFYAGYVAGALMFGRLMSGYAIGYVSDKVGRKPVIITGLLSIMIFSLTFGFSETFLWAIVSRVMIGLTNGIVAAVRTSVREICGREHVVTGMVYIGGAKAMGLLVGSGLGGLLATPAINYPGLFSPTGLFARYPFLLPNVLGAVIAVLILPLVIFWLPETKGLDELRGNGEFTSSRLSTWSRKTGSAVPSRVSPLLFLTETESGAYSWVFLLSTTAPSGETEPGAYSWVFPLPATAPSSQLATVVADENGTTTTDGGTFAKIGSIGGGDEGEIADVPNGDAEEGGIAFCGRGGVIQDGLVLTILFLGCIVQVIVIGFDEVLPLWMLSTLEVGGLSWSSKEIGEVLLTTGIILGLLQLVVLPRILKFIGIVRWQRIGWVVGVVTLVAVPNAKMLSWNSTSLFMLVALGGLLVNCSIAAVMIALNVASTSIVNADHRGKLAGLYNTSESLGRFVGPVMYSTTYALSISPWTQNHPWMDYHFVFYVTAVMMALLAVVGWKTLTPEVLVKEAGSKEPR
ncbi:unnamed protein product, partial [Ascophyllum nodosum]